MHARIFFGNYYIIQAYFLGGQRSTLEITDFYITRYFKEFMKIER